ncbi:MAG: hypothetical protein DI586_07780 [Micavibrio aeruginosavorus]|uniref:Uncharacterized protein n=1 Tax=Micavibrio aeruginosavorus TaxID=349221 RepID=A0A2W5FGJ4_9BACT|nr:MAG: hypothetical protein DI586_07780 [Micavibrio aeruginosavorus]
MITRTLKTLTVILASALLLSSCAGSPPPAAKKPVTSLSSKGASKPELYGDRREALNTTAYIYKKNPKDEFAAGRYAKALRESGDLKKAESVLTPFLKGKSPATLTFTEMGALELETGDFKSAESYARKAIKADGGNYRAWHVLGISLDAQQKHPEAETAFKKALDLWQGDSIPVMNNLALNLAAQGYTDKALNLLYSAKEKDPSRVEIERNIRIIRTLNEPSAYSVDARGEEARKAIAAAKAAKEVEKKKTP